MVDALKRASAKRITVVMPFYGYARQDKKHRGREPISARLIADLFKTAGADRLMAVDLHTAQIQGFFDGPVDHLLALPLLADYVAQTGTPASSSPSSRRTPAGSGSPSTGPTGSAARRWPSSTRRRDPTRPNEAVAQPGRRRGRGPDLRARRRHDRHRRHDREGRRGAAATTAPPDVIVAATHAILSGPAVDRLAEQPAPARSSSPTRCRSPTEQRFDKLTVLSIAPADRPRDPRGVRGRLGHQPVRRPRLSRTAPRAAGARAPRAVVAS